MASLTHHHAALHCTARLHLTRAPRSRAHPRLRPQAPRGLRSPYEEAGLSASLYLEWTATAKPAAVCQLVKASVGAYESAHGQHGAAGAEAGEEEVLCGRAVARMAGLLADEWARESASS